jgi:CRP/FNR family transcriptional regulator, cyclic AMP receptor protein
MRHNHDAKAQQLRQVDLFRRCSPKELARLARIADDAILEAGQVLCHQGEVGLACYVIVEGEVDVVVRHRVIARVGAGQTVGEMALLDGRPRSATVIARSQLHLLVIDADRFSHLLADSPTVTRGLLQELSGRVRELDLDLAEAPVV